MTSTVLTDGRVLHIPGCPFILDREGVIEVPADADLVSVVPLVKADELLLFTKRLVDGARKRRAQVRYMKVNRARLVLARACIDRALAETAPEPREPTSAAEEVARALAAGFGLPGA